MSRACYSKLKCPYQIKRKQGLSIASAVKLALGLCWCCSNLVARQRDLDRLNLATLATHSRNCKCQAGADAKFRASLSVQSRFRPRVCHVYTGGASGVLSHTHAYPLLGMGVVKMVSFWGFNHSTASTVYVIRNRPSLSHGTAQLTASPDRFRPYRCSGGRFSRVGPGQRLHVQTTW